MMGRLEAIALLALTIVPREIFECGGVAVALLLHIRAPHRTTNILSFERILLELHAQSKLQRVRLAVLET